MQAVDPKWIRNPSDHEAIRQGCYFDDEAAEHPIRFIERFCKQSIGRWKGEPLRLFEWQKDFLRRLYGWKLPNGLRRFRRAYLEVAKKNGKSTMLAGLELYDLLADGEGSPEIHVLACDRKQAGIIFNESARMIVASPELKNRLEVVGGKVEGNTDKRIVHPEGNGVIIVSSSVPDSKDGLNPSKVIFDELHRQRGRALWDVFEFAQVARDQPIRIAISTAGEDETGVWHEERQHAEDIIHGVKIDISFLGVVYRADPNKDDLDDPETWRKANPSMGETFSEESFREDLERAKESPVKLALFKRLRLGIVCRSTARFIDPAKWDLCKEPPRSLAVRSKLPCYGGADLSTTTDLSGTVFLHGNFEDGFDVTCHAYLPEDDIVALERRDRVPYRAWADHGYLTLTPGSSIDYDFIREDLKRVASKNDLKSMFFDRFNATQLCNQLIEQDGLPIKFLIQGFISLSPPTKELLRLVLSGKLRHGNHPILKWCVLNAVCQEDSQTNFKLSKKLSRQKIDLAAALVNAIAAAMADSEASGSSSVYDSRGLLFL